MARNMPFLPAGRLVYAAAGAMDHTGLEWAFKAGSAGVAFQVRVLQLAYLVLIAWLAIWLWRSRHRLAALREGRGRTEAVWLLAITAAALALRLWAPASPMDIHHRLVPAWYAWMVDAPYGWGFPVAVVGLWQLFGRDIEIVFLANAIVGALTLLPLNALARSVGMSAAARFWTAVLMATMPLHVRFSHTDNQSILEIPLLLISLWAITSWAKSPRWSLAALAGLCLGVAMCQRPEAGALAIVALAWLMFVARPQRFHLGQASVAVLVVVIVAGVNSLSMVHLLLQEPVANSETMWKVPGLAGWDPTFLVFLDQRWVTPTLWLGMAVGLFAPKPALRVRLGVAVVALVLGLLVWHASPLQLGLIAARHQLRALPFAALLGGMGFAFLLQLVAAGAKRLVDQPALRRGVHGLAGVALVLSPIPALEGAVVPVTVNLEWRFFNEVLAEVPPCCSLVAWFPDNDRSLRTPRYLSQALGARHRWIGLESFEQTRIAPDECLLYYRPASCYAHDIDAPVPASAGGRHAMLPICADWERAHQLEPLLTRALPARSIGTDHFGEGLLHVGFYQLADGRPPPQEGACWTPRGAGAAADWQPAMGSPEAPARGRGTAPPPPPPSKRPWSACGKVYTKKAADEFGSRVRQLPVGECSLRSIDTEQDRVQLTWHDGSGEELHIVLVPTGCAGLLADIEVESDPGTLLRSSEGESKCPQVYEALTELVRSGGGPVATHPADD